MFSSPRMWSRTSLRLFGLAGLMAIVYFFLLVTCRDPIGTEREALVRAVSTGFLPVDAQTSLEEAFEVNGVTFFPRCSPDGEGWCIRHDYVAVDRATGVVARRALYGGSGRHLSQPVSMLLCASAPPPPSGSPSPS